MYRKILKLLKNCNSIDGMICTYIHLICIYNSYIYIHMYIYIKLILIYVIFKKKIP